MSIRMLKAGEQLDPLAGGRMESRRNATDRIQEPWQLFASKGDSRGPQSCSHDEVGASSTLNDFRGRFFSRSSMKKSSPASALTSAL